MQTIYQEKGTQTESEKDTMEEILKAITTLSAKVDSMDKEFQKMKNISQQHDYKHAELRRSEDAKIPELKGDVGKLPKTHNIANVAGTSTGAMEKSYIKKYKPKQLIYETIYSKGTDSRYSSTTNIYICSQPA